MLNKLLFLSALHVCSFACAQVIQDPIAESIKGERAIGNYYQGRTFYKWVFDINHDGSSDVLVALKETPGEVKQEQAYMPGFDPDWHGFRVYLALPGGGCSIGKGPAGEGMGINTAECYVGYIRQMKRYGIVTAEMRSVDHPNEPRARHGVVGQQVYCYTIDRGIIKRTNLTRLVDPEDNNPIYDEYLSEARRSKIQLQEFTP